MSKIEFEDTPILQMAGPDEDDATETPDTDEVASPLLEDEDDEDEEDADAVDDGDEDEDETEDEDDE